MRQKNNIYFNDFSFQDGINATVRRGVEWDVKPKGKYTALHPWAEGKVGIQIFQTAVISFIMIPDDWLKFYHSGPTSRIDLGLKLMRIYPGFHTEEIVTVVFFRVGPQSKLKGD
jgi:hypothetical protein